MRWTMALGALVLAGCAVPRPQVQGFGAAPSLETEEQRVAADRRLDLAGRETRQRMAEIGAIRGAEETARPPLIRMAAERRLALETTPSTASMSSAARQRAAAAHSARLAREEAAIRNEVAEAIVEARASRERATRIERDYQAGVICRERGNMAAAQPAYGGRGLAGAVNAGLQQGWSASEVEAACLRAYSATGVMPSY